MDEAGLAALKDRMRSYRDEFVGHATGEVVAVLTNDIGVYQTAGDHNVNAIYLRGKQHWQLPQQADQSPRCRCATRMEFFYTLKSFNGPRPTPSACRSWSFCHNCSRQNSGRHGRYGLPMPSAAT